MLRGDGKEAYYLRLVRKTSSLGLPLVHAFNAWLSKENHVSHILFCFLIQIRIQNSLPRNLEELRDFLKSMQDNVPSAHDDKDKVPSDGGAKEVDSKVAMLDKDSFEVIIL